jgi:uncharacterized protein YjbJ (UPF0337 family)
MVNCPKCGTKNDEDATFCTHCGVSMRSDIGTTMETQAKQFAHDMEQMGKKVGDNITQAAKKAQQTAQKKARDVEQRMDRMSKRAESWYERSFGPFGPLLESFIFLIVFRLIILVMEHLNQQTPEIRTIAAILLAYIFPLFALSLLSNYTQYLSKKSFSFKVFSPLLYAIFFVLLCWIIAQISLENSLPSIFVFILLIGYVILMVNLPKEKEKKP